jgi:hypothetical protein
MDVYSTVQVQPVFVVFHSTWDIDLCGLLFIVLADNVHILSICESSQFRTEYLRYCFDSTDDTIQEGNPSVHK